VVPKTPSGRAITIVRCSALSQHNEMLDFRA
jgi:hypothetical protein